MSDLKLFSIADNVATELDSRSMELEKRLQQLIEENMETMFGVRFLVSEHSTGKVHRGRIDSLGIDENNFPVIFEYKRASNENVINQGLFYLDWLVDHQGDFEKIVSLKYGREASMEVDWSAPRLICIASDFNRYDEYAVRQIDRNVELVRYKEFDGNLVSIELITTSSADQGVRKSPQTSTSWSNSSVRGEKDRSALNQLNKATADLADLYKKFEDFALNLGDDVVKNARQDYFAFRRMKNFACVEVHSVSNNLLIYLKVNPDDIDLVPGFMRDVRNIGHFGTGDLELRVTTTSPWDVVESLTKQSYENS
ncbi:DUF5655 domain-containing protein [Kocuria carniphila]|uniref:DUF5655 domain-containing protein n=1 Tax=Kocuria carniphila TaxID=262208 RepID=UPI00101B5D6C|nr:DUF5655 domain-containing protein [Kocuria carniphila]